MKDTVTSITSHLFVEFRYGLLVEGVVTDTSHLLLFYFFVEVKSAGAVGSVCGVSYGEMEEGEGCPWKEEGFSEVFDHLVRFIMS